MKKILDTIAALTLQAARDVLPEGVELGEVTLVPRGADPFIGGPRPMLLGCTRWAAVPPGGVLLGGAPEALAELLGFELPPEPVPQVVVEGEVPAPVVPWHEQLAGIATSPMKDLAQAVAHAIARAAALPPECAATSVELTDAPRQLAGALPDAVSLQLGSGASDVRLIVVLPGVAIARFGIPDTDPDDPGVPSARARGATAGVEQEATGHVLASVPLDLSLLLGAARMPLADLLALREGDVIELDESTEAPVALVAGPTTVASGTLEVDDGGRLILQVTDLPGRAHPFT